MFLQPPRFRDWKTVEVEKTVYGLTDDTNFWYEKVKKLEPNFSNWKSKT